MNAASPMITLPAPEARPANKSFMNQTTDPKPFPLLSSLLLLMGFGSALSFAATLPRPEHPRPDVFCYTQLTDVEQEHNGLYRVVAHFRCDVRRTG
jgi:hypothetical protein